jgi:uncharacterized protein YjbI with pentapeptide repeats
MPSRDFSHQDLRNRSFKNQDLTGADFSYSDLRGCDFSGATLTGANFQSCRTGQSYRQIAVNSCLTLVSILGSISIGVNSGIRSFNLLGLDLQTLNEAIFQAFIFTIVTLSIATVSFIFSDIYILPFFDFYIFGVKPSGLIIRLFVFFISSSVIISVSVAGGIATVFLFTKGSILESLAVCSFTVIGILLFLMILYFLKEVLDSELGTTFQGSDLSHAVFKFTSLKKVDFSEADTHFTNWTTVKFLRCKLPLELTNSRVLELSTSRNGYCQDYTHLTLRDLDLKAVDLTRATLFHANLNGSNLQNARLNEANLAHAQALGTDFSEADLTGACIQNWGINSDTNFANVRCDYIYLEPNQQERKPASGTFQPGDFEKLVHQFTKTLDFLFRNGIDPQAFDFALQNLLTDYKDAGLTMHSVIDVGDGDRLVRFNVANPDADQTAMHAQVIQDYESMHKQLEAERAEKYALREQVAEMKGQLSMYREQSVFLQGFVYHQSDRFSRPSINAPNSNFSGEFMSKKETKIQFRDVQGDVSGLAGGDNSGVAGKNITGAAGCDISGTLTVTMGQLEDTKDPQAVELAALLKQVRTAIEKPDAGLSEADQQKALKHLDTIGKLAQDRQNPELLAKAGDALDALPTIMQRSDNLATFVEKYFPTFTAGVKAIFAMWSVTL